MSSTQPFNPRYGSTQSLTPGAGSASVVIDTQQASKQVRIANTGSSTAYVRIGSGTQTATAADYPVPAGNVSIITKDQSHDQLAHIGAGAALLVTLGEGWI